MKPHGILADWEIMQLCPPDAPMILPAFFSQNKTLGRNGKPAISFGISSHGYDVRLGPDVKIFSNLAGNVVDPKNFVPDATLTTAAVHFSPEGEYIILPPHSYALGCTMETFDIPRDVMVVCVGKSTYARCGIHINVTPIEAGFKGNVVIEISNATPLPARIYVKEGIAQFLFFRGEHCDTSYADRSGKYQGQSGITPAKV